MSSLAHLSQLRQPCASSVSRLALAATAGLVALALFPDPALAAPAGGGATMPWTGPLQSLLNNLSGPTARILGALAFVVGGAMWAFTRHEEGAKRFGQAIVGIAVMIGAANIVAALAFVGATV
jgi:type IV secretion system protein TrbC